MNAEFDNAGNLMLVFLKRNIVPRINHLMNVSSGKIFTCIVYHARKKIAVVTALIVARNLCGTSKRFYVDHYLHEIYGFE